MCALKFDFWQNEPNSAAVTFAVRVRPDRQSRLGLLSNQSTIETVRFTLYIRKMPKRVGSGAGALRPAASASPSTVRVSAGSMMPSSQIRAVA
jgi:hypothetical protein